MARNLRFALVVSCFALGFSFVSDTRASICLSNWSVAPAVTGDATWAYIHYSGFSPTTVPVVFRETTSGGVDTVLLTLGGNLTPRIYDLQYSISLSPGATFQTASLSVDLTGAFSAATVTKTLSTTPAGNALATLVSVNGNLVSTAAVNGSTTLYVNENISLTEGEIVSITDTFSESESGVPEPASFVVWGALGAGFVAASLWRGRRSKTRPLPSNI